MRINFLCLHSGLDWKCHKMSVLVCHKQFREMGYLPQALVNYLALLGWGDGTDNEFFTIEQLG